MPKIEISLERAKEFGAYFSRLSTMLSARAIYKRHANMACYKFFLVYYTGVDHRASYEHIELGGLTMACGRTVPSVHVYLPRHCGDITKLPVEVANEWEEYKAYQKAHSLNAIVFSP